MAALGVASRSELRQCAGVGDPVEFQIFVTYPPDREGRVPQLCVVHDDVLDIPAEVFREGDQTMVTLFSRATGPAWTFPLADFVGALDKAAAALDAPPQSHV